MVSRSGFVIFGVVTALFCLLFGGGCGGDDPSQAPSLRPLAVTPGSGQPGQLLAISGAGIPPEDTDTVTLYIGGFPTPHRLGPDGSLSAPIPLFLGENAWPEPPSGPQTVELRRGLTVLARAEGALTVLPREPAPGSTRTALQALTTIRDIYGSLLGAMELTEPREEVLRATVLAMWDAHVHGAAGGRREPIAVRDRQVRVQNRVNRPESRRRS